VGLLIATSASRAYSTLSQRRNSFFWLREIQRFAHDLVLQDLLTEQPPSSRS
jgi:hypothetical protein